MAWRGLEMPPLQNLSQSWLILDLRVGSSICVHLAFFLCSCSIISIGHSYPYTLGKFGVFHQSIGVTFDDIGGDFIVGHYNSP